MFPHGPKNEGIYMLSKNVVIDKVFSIKEKNDCPVYFCDELRRRHENYLSMIAAKIRGYIERKIDRGEIVTSKMVIAYCSKHKVDPSVTRTVLNRLVYHGVLKKTHITIRSR